MSYTARFACACTTCGANVPVGTGTVREYTGSAKQWAPRNALTTEHGKRTITCTGCERDRTLQAAARRTHDRETQQRMAAKRLGV